MRVQVFLVKMSHGQIVCISIPNKSLKFIAHEMGHLFWLGDNPYTAETSLMSHNRDRETVIRPQYIDVYHVVNKYS